MSFATEIKTVLNADSSINSYVDGGIHYENLIDNWLGGSTFNKWIVYEFRKQSQVDCVNSKNIYMNYVLSCIVIQRNTNDEIDIITNRLINYLNHHQSGNIIDIKFDNDQNGFNQQQQVYTNSLDFNVQYLES